MMGRGWPAGFAATVAMSLLWVPLGVRTVPSEEPYVQQLSAGYGHTCAVFSDGSVKCWGLNSDGQLGLGDTATRGDVSGEMGAALLPIELGGGWRVIQVAAGGAHTCALRDTGEVKCWGRNDSGQLGLGHTAAQGDQEEEMAALLTVDLDGTARALSAGASHTCAVLDSGDVKCWGSNQYGELGQGNTENQGDNYSDMGRLEAVDLGEPAVAVTAGRNYTCAVLESGAVKCWGRNDSGQLGLGDTRTRGDDPNEMGAFLPYVDLVGTARAVSVGRQFSCALLDSAAVRCWGRAQYGQLGLGGIGTWGDGADEMGAALPAVDLDGTGVQLAVGHDHSCALLEWGVVKCWGWNSDGRLGLGDTLDRGDEVVDMGVNLPAVDLIQDVFPPDVIVPGPMSPEATGPEGAVVVFFATAFDVPHPSPAVSCSRASGETFWLGATRVECWATDAAGNRGVGVFTVTVRDTTPPVVTPPANVTVGAAGSSGAVVFYPPATATDAVGVTSGPGCLPASGSPFPVGTTTVICSASDKAGNRGEASFHVTVNPFVPIVQHTLFRSEGACDGWVLEADETSGKGGTFDAAAVTARVGDDALDRQYRAILDFDTAGLPDNAVITGVVLRIKRESVAGANPFDTHGYLIVDVKTGFYHDIQLLEKYDFQAAGSRGNVGRFIKTPDAGWYRAPLRARSYGLINLVGHTQFRLRFEVDDNDNSTADYLSFFTGNTPTVTDRPELIITYHTP